jgi:hypothetical protein
MAISTIKSKLDAAVKASLTQMAKEQPGVAVLTGEYVNQDLGVDGTVTVVG